MTNLPFITCGKTRLLNLPHAAEVIREIWEEDCYRLNEIPDGSIVFDVGAFYGEFGLICRRNKGCGVIAYEPVPSNFSVVRLNLELNGAFDKFTIKRCCIVGNVETGPRSVFYNPDHPAGSSATPMDGGIQEMAHPVLLSQEIRDTSFAMCSHHITVKLDCEGSERGIFNDDPGWIDHVQIVTMEWHNYDGDFYAGILEKAGFGVELSGGGPKPRPAWDRSMGGGLLFAKRRSQ